MSLALLLPAGRNSKVRFYNMHFILRYCSNEYPAVKSGAVHRSSKYKKKRYMTQQQSKQGLGTGYESSAFTKNIPSPKVTVASTAGIYYRNNVPWSRVAVHNKWQYATIGSTQQLAVHNKCLYATSGSTQQLAVHNKCQYATSGSTQQLAVHNKCQYATSGSTQVDNRSGSEDCVT